MAILNHIKSFIADPPSDALGAALPGTPGTPANADKTGPVAGTYKTYFSAPRAERSASLRPRSRVS